MPDAVPRSLFLTRRSLCPDCGSPLELSAGAASVDCVYCGGRSYVERRLRLLEPELDGSPATANAVGRWVAPHLIAGGAFELAHCQGCGNELQLDGLAAAVPCGFCGTSNRVERRLTRAAPTAPPSPEAVLRQADAHDRSYVEKLVELLASDDEATRVELAHELSEPWGAVNESIVRLLPTIVECMERSSRAVDKELYELLLKFLCSHDQPHLRNAALRAAEPHAFAPHGSTYLLRALGLGDAPCLKLLMDVASHAHHVRDRRRECQAVAALNWAVQRIGGEAKDYPRDVMLYRLPYLDGSVRDFVLLCLFARRGNGFTYDFETVMRHVDDLAREMPELVPYVRHLAPAASADEAEWRRRAELIADLETVAAKDAALRMLSFPTDFLNGKDVHTDEGVAEVLRTITPLLDDPRLVDATSAALCAMITTPREVPRPVVELVRDRGDALPEEVRRTFLREVPDSTLLSQLPVRYWQSPDPTVVGSTEWLHAELDRMARTVNELYHELERLEQEVE